MSKLLCIAALGRRGLTRLEFVGPEQTIPLRVEGLEAAPAGAPNHSPFGDAIPSMKTASATGRASSRVLPSSQLHRSTASSAMRHRALHRFGDQAGAVMAGEDPHGSRQAQAPFS
jgi:hypothetical protein